MKDILGYEGLYKINENGEIYSIPRKGTINNIRKISQRKNKYGYMQVVLMKNNKMKTFLVHRLVAQAFIPNYNSFPQVNHIDGNKANNRVANLQWCTVSHNTKHAYENNLGGFRDVVSKNLQKINDKNAYHYVEIKNEYETKIFSSTSDASKYLNTHKDNITRAFRKNQKCKGYTVICKRTANGEA